MRLSRRGLVRRCWSVAAASLLQALLTARRPSKASKAEVKQVKPSSKAASLQQALPTARNAYLAAYRFSQQHIGLVRAVAASSL